MNGRTSHSRTTTPHGQRRLWNGRARGGLSLLEVMLAIAILGGSLAVLGQLVRIGSRSAMAVRDLTQAQLLCENRMAEISAGVYLPEPTAMEPIEETGEWLCSVDVQPVDDLGLLAVTVYVEQDPEQIARPATFSLTRWMVDPSVEQANEEAALAAKEAAAQEAAANQNVSGSSQSGSGGSSGSGQSGNGSGNDDDDVPLDPSQIPGGAPPGQGGGRGPGRGEGGDQGGRGDRGENDDRGGGRGGRGGGRGGRGGGGGGGFGGGSGGGPNGR